MTHAAPCLTQLADDIESHGNMLALLTDIHSSELSHRGRVGLLQLSASLMENFDDIEIRFRIYRTSLRLNC